MSKKPTIILISSIAFVLVVMAIVIALVMVFSNSSGNQQHAEGSKHAESKHTIDNSDILDVIDTDFEDDNIISLTLRQGVFQPILRSW
jgi:flagellar basal body-associated protein FliL